MCAAGEREKRERRERERYKLAHTQLGPSLSLLGLGSDLSLLPFLFWLALPSAPPPPPTPPPSGTASPTHPGATA